MSHNFWKKFDRILSNIERKGFEAANKAHVYSVNILIGGFLYGAYTMFRDYNSFFKDARVKKLIK